MIDSELAQLYQVETRVLIQGVKRNLNRFPDDFMFQLTAAEADGLRSQSVISNGRSGGRRYRPYAFTEHGVAMLSSVLKSARAVQMNIVIIRAFVKLRELVNTHRELSGRMDKLEITQKRHGSAITVVIDEIKSLKRLPSIKPKRPIGFRVAGK